MVIVNVLNGGFWGIPDGKTKCWIADIGNLVGSVCPKCPKCHEILQKFNHTDQQRRNITQSQLTKKRETYRFFLFKKEPRKQVGTALRSSLSLERCVGKLAWRGGA